MIIKVTQDDIWNGIKDDCCNCPVALAIGRRFPVESVAVRSLAITIGGIKFPLPVHVWQWIRKFDTGCAVEPFEFELPEKL